jgi:hypothetical protein
MKLSRCITTVLLALLFVWIVTGCSMTVNPDGTRTWSLDAEEAARAIIIYSDK